MLSGRERSHSTWTHNRDAPAAAWNRDIDVVRFTEALRRKHVVNALRRHRAFRSLLRAVDFPTWHSVAGVSGPVRLRWFQHASYYLPTHGPEPEIAALMIALVRTLTVRSFVDVGANMGYYTWLVADHADGEVEIHMFEPDAANESLARRTLARRRHDNVRLHPVAVSADDGEGVLYRDLDTGHRSSLVAAVATAGGVVTPTCRLDTVVPNPAPPVLVKIDVEGAEEQVLLGASSLLAQEPVIVMECYHGGDDAAWRSLAAFAYRLFDAATLGEATSATTNYLAVPQAVTDEELSRVADERARMLHAPRLPRRADLP